MRLLGREFGKSAPKPDREAEAKKHFGGSKSVFARPTPSADLYRSQAKASSTRSPKPFTSTIIRPGSWFNPGKPAAPATERQTAANASAAAEKVRLSMGVVPETRNAQEYLNWQEDIATEQKAADAAAPANNGAWGSFVPKEKPPNSVLQALNEKGFKVDEPKKSPGMPASSFLSTTSLADHTYRISNIENEYLENSFNTPTVMIGQSPGVIKPPGVPIDEALPVMHMEPTESAALTWESYDELSNHQKAAVDWNTLLIDAREKDLTDSTRPLATPKERQEYDVEVERLFGEQGGSNRYAPNVVDLLSKLDMVQVGQDLDEYLSLERAIDDTQLSDFKFTTRDIATLELLADAGEEQQQTSYATARSGGNISALNTGNADAVTDMIRSRLKNPEIIASDFESLVYGSADAKVAPIGFGDSTTDIEFQKSLAVLGMEDPTLYGVPEGVDPMSFIITNLEGMGADEQQTSQFLDYVGQQTALYGQYGDKDQKVQAEMVRKRAGLGG